MPEHGRLARAALEAGKHVLVEKPVATTLEEAELVLATAADAPGHLVCAPHILLSPTYRTMHARVRARRDRRAADRARPLRLGRPGLEPLVLRAGRRLAVRPRRLQRHEPVRLLRARAAGDGDDRRRDPRADRRRRADPGAGGRQRARADRLRRRALRRRHHRLHDAGVPLAGDRALRDRRRAAAARRRLGAGGLRALPQRHRRLGAAPRDRPDVALDRRAAPPGRVHRDRDRAGHPARARATTRSRSCSPPRRPAPTGGRARSARTSPSRTSRGSAPSAANERVHDPRSAL